MKIWPPAADRFWSHIEPEPNTGCWLWVGSRNSEGYGVIGDRGRNYAHRWSYEHFIGPIIPGLQIDHLCRVRACVNPQHLEPVTPLINQARVPGSPVAKHYGIADCLRGHGNNWWHGTQPTHSGKRAKVRRWRACHAENERQRRLRLKGHCADVNTPADAEAKNEMRPSCEDHAHDQPLS